MTDTVKDRVMDIFIYLFITIRNCHRQFHFCIMSVKMDWLSVRNFTTKERISFLWTEV